MVKYPDTPQFDQVVREIRLRHNYQGKDEAGEPIYRQDTPYPKLKFKGTVKSHGTNAGILKTKDGVFYQSRERVLSLDQDNSGFMAAMVQKNLDSLFTPYEFEDYVAIYGEWCGKTIQKGVAVSQLERMFLIFAVKVDGKWVDFKPCELPEGIYHIDTFGTYSVEIDFNTPDFARNKIVEMTQQVEDECPIGKYFGVSGVGEGIVFRCVDVPEIVFKSKGDKHAVSRVKKLNPVDTEETELILNFVQGTVTEARLEQGLTYLSENGMEKIPQNIGHFLRWVVGDVLKEESWRLDDIEKERPINRKKVNVEITTLAKRWSLNN